MEVHSETEVPKAADQAVEKNPAETAQQSDSLPFVTLWQDKTGVIQIKLGNNLTPVNAVALLELGLFRYKASLLPAISPRPAQAPQGSEPQI